MREKRETKVKEIFLLLRHTNSFPGEHARTQAIKIKTSPLFLSLAALVMDVDSAKKLPQNPPPLFWRRRALLLLAQMSGMGLLPSYFWTKAKEGQITFLTVGTLLVDISSMNMAKTSAK